MTKHQTQGTIGSLANNPNDWVDEQVDRRMGRGHNFTSKWEADVDYVVVHQGASTDVLNNRTENHISVTFISSTAQEAIKNGDIDPVEVALSQSDFMWGGRWTAVLNQAGEPVIYIAVHIP